MSGLYSNDPVADYLAYSHSQERDAQRLRNEGKLRSCHGCGEEARLEESNEFPGPELCCDCRRVMKEFLWDEQERSEVMIRPHDRKYLAWIREQPCVICGMRTAIEAAHTGSRIAYRVGMGQKPPDGLAIPLCVKCHRYRANSYHTLDEKHWVAYHELNLTLIRRELRRRYRIELKNPLQEQLALADKVMDRIL